MYARFVVLMVHMLSYSTKKQALPACGENYTTISPSVQKAFSRHARFGWLALQPLRFAQNGADGRRERHELEQDEQQHEDGEGRQHGPLRPDKPVRQAAVRLPAARSGPPQMPSPLSRSMPRTFSCCSRQERITFCRSCSGMSVKLHMTIFFRFSVSLNRTTLA